MKEVWAKYKSDAKALGLIRPSGWRRSQGWSNHDNYLKIIKLSL